MATHTSHFEIASLYSLWMEYADTLGIDSREDFDAMPHAEKMAMLRACFGADMEEQEEDRCLAIESAPPMTPERQAEVEIMYARAEAAAATIRAVTRWRAALAGMTSADPNEALNAVWEAGEAYESISIEN